jgi:hypothetical protein
VYVHVVFLSNRNNACDMTSTKDCLIGGIMLAIDMVRLLTGANPVTISVSGRIGHHEEPSTRASMH